MKWQPIDTAPKDGTHILIIIPYTEEWRKPTVAIARWYNDSYNRKYRKPRPYWQWDEMRVGSQRELQPTRWMPLPEVPEEVEQP